MSPRHLVPRSLLVGLAACTAGGTTVGSTDVVCRGLTVTQGASVAADNPFTGTVFTIVMENKSAPEILGAGSPAPYVRGLAAAYAVAQGYEDPLIHPSEPNYLWMIAGENFGVLDDADPSSHPIDSTSHLADQLERAGVTWKTYQESMGAPCGLESHYPYAAKHNPFIYFDDINGWDGRTFTRPARCSQHVVDYSALDADLAAGTVPRYVFITPNLQSDMHDGSIADGDTWLAREVPKIMASPAYQQGGVLFLTWDEGSGGADDPPMIVISPLAKQAFVSTEPYDTSSFLLTVESIFGLDALPCAAAPADVTPMADLFAVPLGAPVMPAP